VVTSVNKTNLLSCNHELREGQSITESKYQKRQLHVECGDMLRRKIEIQFAFHNVEILTR
jgi:hypothetical protein